MAEYRTKPAFRSINITLLSVPIIFIMLAVSLLFLNNTQSALFGSYISLTQTFIYSISLVVSIINLYLFYLLTSQINNHSMEKDKPILVFVVKPNQWKIKNVGLGAALNIIVIEYRDQEGVKPENAVLYPSLTSSENQNIQFLYPKKFKAFYEDIFGNLHVSSCENYISEIGKLIEKNDPQHDDYKLLRKNIIIPTEEEYLDIQNDSFELDITPHSPQNGKEGQTTMKQ